MLLIKIILLRIILSLSNEPFILDWSAQQDENAVVLPFPEFFKQLDRTFSSGVTDVDSGYDNS